VGSRSSNRIALVAALAVALALAGVATASVVRCGKGLCLGTKRNDSITGSGKADRIKALAGRDVVQAKGGKDVAFRVAVQDGKVAFTARAMRGADDGD